MQAPTPSPTPSAATPGTAPQAPVAPLAPLSTREVAAIRQRRAELSSQLLSAQDRRNELAQQLREALPGADRGGIEQRISLLDARMLQLETDIAATGRQLTLAGTLGAGTQVPGMPSNEPSPGQITAMSIVFILCVLAPIALAFARRLWKRATSPAAAVDLGPVVRRLDELQQSVDTVAIEMERMSEGQRYVARVLSEGPAPLALGPGEAPAQPIRVPDKDAVRAPRSGS